MTRRSLLPRVWPAVGVGLLWLACGVGAQSPGERVFRHVVGPPSSDLTAYVEGDLIRVKIPSNWRELPGSNAVTFAPEGAYGNAGVKSVFTHGIAMGLARNDKHNLRVTTDDFIRAYVLVNPPDRTFPYSHVRIGDRPGLHTVLASVSEATGEPEQIDVFTTLLRDGALLYVQAVAPRQRASDYARTFRRIVESIEIMDCDRRDVEDMSVADITIPFCSERAATRPVRSEVHRLSWTSRYRFCDRSLQCHHPFEQP